MSSLQSVKSGSEFAPTNSAPPAQLGFMLVSLSGPGLASGLAPGSAAMARAKARGNETLGPGPVLGLGLGLGRSGSEFEFEPGSG